MQPFHQETKGFSTTSLSNIPAYHHEPQMPPENESRRWILIYYEPDRKMTADKYWKAVGKDSYKDYKPFIKVNGDVKAIAAEVTAGANSDADKARRIYDYCHKHIRSVFSDEVTAAERDAMKENRTSIDTLKQGIGTGLDINLAFAALAIASGLDARVALLPDRNEVFFQCVFLSLLFPSFHRYRGQRGWPLALL